MRKYILAPIAFFALFSCKKLEVVQDSVSEVAELFASMEHKDRTKTVLDDNNNVLWSEDDQLVAFMRTTQVLKYKIKEESVGTTSGGFSRVSDL